MLSFPLENLPPDVLFVLTTLIMADEEFSQQDRLSYLLADPALRQFNLCPGIRVKITNKRLLRELHAAATSFRAVFPSSSFSNIWLIQTTIPRNPILKSMVSDLFQVLPSMTQLNLSFDRLSDFSPNAFLWLKDQAQHLRSVEILRIKYNVDWETLEDQDVVNPWSPSLPVTRFLEDMKGLRVVLLRTPLVVALKDDAYDHIQDLGGAKELAWVRSWANNLPSIQSVFLAHAFDDDIGEGGFLDSGRKTAFLRQETSEWSVKSWWKPDLRHPVKSLYSDSVDVAKNEQDPYDSDT